MATLGRVWADDIGLTSRSRRKEFLQRFELVGEPVKHAAAGVGSDARKAPLEL